MDEGCNRWNQKTKLTDTAQRGEFSTKKLTKRDHARILFEGTADNTQSGRQNSIKLAETLDHDNFGGRHADAAWDAHDTMVMKE